MVNSGFAPKLEGAAAGVEFGLGRGGRCFVSFAGAAGKVSPWLVSFAGVAGKFSPWLPGFRNEQEACGVYRKLTVFF